MRRPRSAAAIVLGVGLAVGAAGTAAASPAGASPPSIVRLRIGRPVIGPRGGAATIRLEVRNAATCWFSAPAAVRVSRAMAGCRAGLRATVLRLGPADTTRARRFAVTGWVRSASGATAHAVVYVRQRGLAPLRARLSPDTPVVVGRPSLARLVVTGGRAPYTVAVTGGNLPSGISLSRSGELTGTPSGTGSFKTTVTITDASRPHPLRTSVTVTLLVVPPPVSITTSGLPSTVQGQSYQAVLSASGGTAPYTWSVVGGSLPSGIMLQSNGTLVGTPASSGSFAVTVKATDASSPALSATRQLTLVVQAAPLVVTTPVLLTAIAGQAYLQYLPATGGTPPYTWTLGSGSLPPGLTLTSNGAIQGTPTTYGTYPLVVLVTDSSQPQESAYLLFTIEVTSSQLTILTPSILTPSAILNTYYSFQFAASGGTAPYRWQLVSGTMPPGLTLSIDGLLSGKATAQGTYTFTVEVFDSAYPVNTDTKTVTLTVS